MIRPITVYLSGGLGNQLFRWYAGFALSQLRGTQLVLDDSRSEHGQSLRPLELPGVWKNAHPDAKLRNVPVRVTLTALRKSHHLSQLLRLYESKVPNYDPLLYNQPAGSRIWSLSLSYKSVLKAITLGAPHVPKVRRESSWLDEMRRIAAQEKPIMVHVRRGDYLANRNFRVLNHRYFDDALQVVHAQGIDGPIWVFSDEVEGIPLTLRRKARVVSSPDGALDELLLMSNGAANILSNSTFSWWAAWFNQNGGPVVYPDPFLDLGHITQEIAPPWWTPLLLASSHH